MTDIRSFRNADLPQLANLFCQHHRLAGKDVHVSVPQFEQAILARAFFDPDSLIVVSEPDADGQGVVKAWCQSGLSIADESERQAVITALCYSEECETESATRMIQELSRRCENHSLRLSKAGLFHDDRFGFAGLEPLGPCYGIDRMDYRTQRVLQTCGFTAGRMLIHLSAATQSYRPAFSRESLRLRRSTSVQKCRWVPDAIRQSQALSHLDIERHALVDRDGSVIGGMDFWFSDAEAQVMPPSKAIVDLSAYAGKLPVTDSFLITAVVSTLADRGVQQVGIAVDAEQGELIDQLSTIGFTPVSDGTLWERD